MRWISLAAALFLAPLAQAAEPGACQELSLAETAFEEARDEVDHLTEVAFGDAFLRKIAWAEADERDALVAEREEARKSLSDARKELRQTRRDARKARGEVKADGVVCAPAETDEDALPS